LFILAVAVLPAFGQKSTTTRSKITDKNGITVEDVVQKEGVIAAIRRPKAGKVELELKQEGASKNETFTLDWRTMVYKLSERNVEIFKEQDRLADIVKDINKLRSRQDELPEKEMKYQLSTWEHLYVSYWGRVTYYSGYSPSAAEGLHKAQMAWKKEEEERKSHYGPRIRLQSGYSAIVIAAKSSDTTYAVFVTSKLEEPKDEKNEKALPTTPPAEDEATRKLKFAENMLDEAKKAKGSEKDKLLDSARERLQEIIKKYPDSDAAKKAKELLDKS
jgi:hypothetical protein